VLIHSAKAFLPEYIVSGPVTPDMDDASDHLGLMSTKSSNELPPKVDVECGVELLQPLARKDLKVTILPFHDHVGCFIKLDHIINAKYGCNSQ